MDVWKEGGLRTYVMGRNEATGGKCCKPLLCGGDEWGLQGAQRLLGAEQGVLCCYRIVFSCCQPTTQPSGLLGQS